MECKAFDQAMREIIRTPEKAKKWFADKRMTLLEKKIIEGHLLIRNNLNSQVVEIYSALPDSHIDYVNAHKDLLIGIATNNLSLFEKAEFHLRRAASMLQKLELSHYHFSAHFNLFMLYSNLNDLAQMKQSLDCMKSVKLDTRLMELRLMRCQFIYADESENVNEAKRWIKTISSFKDEMIESDLIAQLVAEFMFYVKHESFHQARVILNQMKSHRKFQLTENFNFSKKLLDHLTVNAPIYAYEKDFAAVPILLHQLKVIQAMEGNEVQEAKKYWGLLQKDYPKVYLEDFRYSGQKCLFSLCLDKYKSQEAVSPSLIDAQENSKAETLIALLRASEGPLSKGYVYEVLWGTPPENKEDMKRLTRLVSKIRVKQGLEIQTRKGSYFLEEKLKKIKMG